MPAQQARLVFPIIPGESIGPFKLGMSRSEARTRGDRDVQPAEVSEAAGESDSQVDYFPHAGVKVYYDEAGRCHKIEALIGYATHLVPIFTLFGVEMNWLDDAEVIKLCRSHWPDTSNSYTGLKVPSAGLEATYWDYIDHYYHSIAVVQKTNK